MINFDKIKNKRVRKVTRNTLTTYSNLAVVFTDRIMQTVGKEIIIQPRVLDKLIHIEKLLNDVVKCSIHIDHIKVQNIVSTTIEDTYIIKGVTNSINILDISEEELLLILDVYRQVKSRKGLTIKIHMDTKATVHFRSKDENVYVCLRSGSSNI